ncbi:TPA_exp: Uncharacterized protein A8136_2358 [Trichophyton benhamiae CBS 112371]|nr:TPA_exp: Uncharacterized protein A8136_2358 [Trichophyton benhamiae CBS 112371]
MVGHDGGPPPSKKLKTSSNGYQANSSGSPRKPESPSGPGLPSRQKIIPSPIQLTHIRDISDSTGYNEGCIKLRDILGDPMIKECWQFNYLFDVDYIMGQFDRDVKDLIQLKIIHGSWKKEAPNRIAIDDACKRYPNAEAVVAYMPEPFGTHHSKMMILIRHDNLAQVIIHTANMIPRDWGNMTQAVWRSPLLPLSQSQVDDTCGVFGSSARFKRDLLAYLEAYNNKTINILIRQLRRYDFGAVKALLIASVPTRLPVKEFDSNRRTLWGWPALKDAIGSIPIDRSSSQAQNPHIIVQVRDAEDPKNSDPATKSDRVREAGRRRAAPHIKTYIRFSDSDMNSIDWAMITSANLSTQAWGAGANTQGEVRICSWEVGVLIWPDLFREENIEECSDSSLTNYVKMIPCFKRNVPSEKPLQTSENDSTKVTLHSDATNMTRVGLRMPYDLPLIPYTPQEVPWCATAVHREPDWMGQTWEESD